MSSKILESVLLEMLHDCAKDRFNYPTPEKELLAIVMAIEHWHTYLYGRKFVVYTDHQPLAWLLNKKNPHPRLERWLIRLAQYRFEIKYRKGIENVVADALSRLPSENQVNENINDDYFDTLVAMIEEDESIQRARRE